MNLSTAEKSPSEQDSDTDWNHMACSPWRKLRTLERQGHLLKTGHLSDCTFLVGVDTKAEEIRGHKLILCHSSEVFEAMFCGDLKEEGVVKIEDISSKMFRKLLEYIYTDHVELDNVETALGVYYAAKKYLISRLCFTCHQYITQNLSPLDIVKTLEFARLASNKELEEFAIKKLCEETSDAISDDSFVDAEVSTLLTLLEQNELSFNSEAMLFSACLLWARNRVTEEKSLREALNPILHLFRFRAMSVSEFAEFVCKAEILTMEEGYMIFMCLVTNSNQMPNGFSNETNPRQKIPKNEIVLFSSPSYTFCPASPTATRSNFFTHRTPDRCRLFPYRN